MRIGGLLVAAGLACRAAFGACTTPVFVQVQPNLPAVGTGSTPWGLATGDFDHDGTLDYATSDTTNGAIIVYLNNGNGTFKAGVSYPTGGVGASYPIAADFNNDGSLDIAVPIVLRKTATSRVP